MSNEKPLLVFLLDQNVRSPSEQEKIDSIQNDMTYFWTNFSEPISLDLVSPKNESDEMDRFAHRVCRIGRMSSADSKQISRMASLLFFPEPKRKFYSMCLLTGTTVFNANLEMLRNETPDDLSK